MLEARINELAQTVRLKRCDETPQSLTDKSRLIDAMPEYTQVEAQTHLRYALKKPEMWFSCAARKAQEHGYAGSATSLY